MADLVFACGFECGRLQLGGPHFLRSGSELAVSITTDSPLSGNRSLLIDAFNELALATTVPIFAGGLVIFRVRVQFDSLFDVNTVIASNTFRGGAVFNAADNKIYAGRSVTALGATGVSVTTGVLYWIDVRIDTTGNPWLIDVMVNGEACGQYSEAHAADMSSMSLSFGSSSFTGTGTARFDDIAVSLTSGDYPLGNGYGNPFVPTADGTHNVAGANDFFRTLSGTDIDNSTTDAYLLVDDIPVDTGVPTDFINLVAPANATDYVEVKFGPAPGISAPTAPPQGVEVVTVCAAQAEVANNLRLALNDNGSLDDVRNATIETLECLYNRKHYAVGPSTGAWVIGGGGNGDFTDLRMRCYSSDANPDAYFVGTMIEADFPTGGSSSESASPSTSASASPSVSPSTSESASPSASPSGSSSESASPSASPSASESPSPSLSESSSPSPSASASESASPSSSVSASPSLSESASPSASASASESSSESASPSFSVPVTFEPICYNFSSSTVDADPGDGMIRFNRAIQNTTDRIIIDLLDASLVDQSAVIDGLESPLIQIRLELHSDPAKWIRFQVVDVENFVFFRVINVTEISSSEANPFNDGDLICLSDAAHSPSVSPSTSPSASPSPSTSASTSASASPSTSVSFSFPPCAESGEAVATFVPAVWNGVISGAEQAVPTFTTWNGVTSGSAVAPFIEVPCV